MKFGKLFGWGIVIYAIMRMVWDALVIYGFSTSLFSRGINVIALLVLCTIAGRSLRFKNWTDIVPYSIGWVIIVAALDAVYVVPFAGWSLYSNPNLWVGYIFVVVFPLLASLTTIRREDREPLS